MGNSITGGHLKKNVHLVMYRLTVDILTLIILCWF